MMRWLFFAVSDVSLFSALRISRIFTFFRLIGKEARSVCFYRWSSTSLLLCLSFSYLLFPVSFIKRFSVFYLSRLRCVSWVKCPIWSLDLIRQIEMRFGVLFHQTQRVVFAHHKFGIIASFPLTNQRIHRVTVCLRVYMIMHTGVHLGYFFLI